MLFIFDELQKNHGDYTQHGLFSIRCGMQPMTLGNLRANGVHTLAAWCLGRGCNHNRILDVSSYPDDVPVPSFGRRMVCTICGAIGADARPNWKERAPPNLFATMRAVERPQIDSQPAPE
jgi:hypothetical protein